MKIAVVYNRASRSVINLFGMPNQEKIGLKTVRRIVDALKLGGHQAVAMEGDKELVDRLEEFMPRVLKGENPGMVFNLSYGIQGQARYTHVPSILEMVGIPYVGSGPLAHSLALDKVVSKMIFKQHGIPTADFAVLSDAGFDAPGLTYPLIVKPKNEAVSFGIRVVKNEKELREAADVIFAKFNQPVLAERYIDGREVNVGLIGNHPPETLPPAEIVFGRGPRIYSYEDKTHQSGREVKVRVPAKLSAKQTQRAQSIARDAFTALGCCDCARVDMRMDRAGNFYVLEINSLPSLGEHGSYTHAAEAVGLDYAGLVNRLVDVASARYFGTPTPPEVTSGDAADRPGRVFNWITQRRDRAEKRLRDWIHTSSRTGDPVGLREARRRMEASMTQLRMTPVADLSNEHSAWTWETGAGLDGGTLLIAHLDVPLPHDAPTEAYRRDPEWLYGEGAGTRAPLVMLEFALQALRSQRRLRRIPLGVLLYSDEGRDAAYSAETIHRAAARARQVIVLRPGGANDTFIRQRRGQRKYTLSVEGRSRRPGQVSRGPDALSSFADIVKAVERLQSRKDRIGVAAMDVRTHGFPMMVPHRARTELLVTYLDARRADEAEQEVRALFGGNGLRWSLELVSDRPAMKPRVANRSLGRRLIDTAGRWEVEIGEESSLCISLVQRTLLLAQFLLENEPS
jgi:D-alanine-D-alanine ligase